MPGDWSITITDTNNTTYSPALLTPRGEVLPRRIPQANGRPILEFGVAPERDSNGSPKWFDAKFEEADVSVSLDGTDQPYDTLVGMRDRPSAGVVILRAQGGDELEKPVSLDVDGARPTHEIATDIVSNNTSYNTDIPRPSTTTDEGVQVQSRSGFASSDLEHQRPDSPVHVANNGDVTLHQTLFFNDPSTTLSSEGDEIAFDINLEYEIPPERVGVALLTDVGSSHIGLSFKVDGVEIGRIFPGATFSSTPKWVQATGRDERLAPGTHEVVIEVTDSTGAAGGGLTAVTPSGIAAYDDAYSYRFDPDLVQGPTLYPVTFVWVGFREPLTTRAVNDIDYRTYWADNEAGELNISNGEVGFGTQGPQASRDFPRAGPVIEVEVGLSAYGDDSTKTPEQGFKRHRLTAHRIDADLETLPLVVDEQFEGTVAEVLTELTDTLRGDFVWTYDTDSNGDGVVRFVQTGDRSTIQSDIEAYSVEKRVDRVLDEVTVRGHPVDISGEAVRVQHDTAVDVSRDDLVENSETVTDAVTGKTYERGVHYSVDYDAGTITADSTPSRADPIEDESRVRLSYQFQPGATVEASSKGTPVQSETIDALPLRSDRACRLAGEQLLEALSTPAFDATAELRGNTTYSVVTDLASGRLPASNLATVDTEATPAGASVRLEGRQDIGAAVAALRERLEGLARSSR